MAINEDGLVSGCFMILINGGSFVLNIALLVNLIKNRASLPPYMYLVLNLTVSDILFSYLGLTMRAPGMINNSFYTGSAYGRVTCVVFFYAVYPVISTNFNTYCLLVLNQFLAIRSPLRFSRQGTRQKYMIKRAIVGIWILAGVYLAIYMLLVHTGIGKADYDETYSRCALTSTESGKTADIILKVFIIFIPSFTSLGLYIGIAVLLAKNKKRNCGGVTMHAFVTISILLGLFYLSHWPSLLLRDLPKLFKASISLPKTLTISMSVFYYLNTLTDPIVYGFRSQYLFRTVKKTVGMKMSRFSGNSPDHAPGTSAGAKIRSTATIETTGTAQKESSNVVVVRNDLAESSFEHSKASLSSD